MATEAIKAFTHSFRGTCIAGTWLERVFFNSPLGIIQVDRDGRIEYANPYAESLLGFQSFVGLTILDLAPDKQVADFLKTKLAERVQGEASDYEVELKRIDDGKKFPVHVAAMPVLADDGCVTGAIAILRNLEIERATKAFNLRIATARSTRDLLAGIAKETGQVITFDALTASVLGREGKHARIVFEYPSQIMPWPTRWVPIIGAVPNDAEVTLKTVQEILDIYRSTGCPQSVIKPVTRLLELGFCWIMRCPVHSEGRQVGTIALLRKGDQPFSKGEQEAFARLPLDKALLVALHLEERSEREFRFELITELSTILSDKQVFDTVVMRIAKHYGWSHVSMFTVDAERKRIVVSSQCGISPEYSLPRDYCQRADNGILGYAYQNDRDVNVGNVETDPEFKNVYMHSPLPFPILSEACLRISTENGICALLNLEDRRENAFSSDDIDALREVLNEIAGVIERRRIDNLAVAALNATTSAVLVITNAGVISRVNPAAERLFGNTQRNLIGKTIANFIEDPLVAEAITRSKRPKGEVTFQGRDGKPILALVDGVTLDNYFGQRMLIIRRSESHKASEELEVLSSLYAELSRQMNTPLSIVGTSLRTLEELARRGFWQRAAALFGKATSLEKTLPGTVHQILRQLRKIELTYDKLLFFGDPEQARHFQLSTVFLPQFVFDVIRDLPTLESEKVKVIFKSSAQYMELDSQQIGFVLQTLVGYLLRFSPGSQGIEMEIFDIQGEVHITLSGPYLQRAQKRMLGSADRLFAKSLDNFVTARKTLNQFMTNHGGLLEDPVTEKNRIMFHLKLPRKTSLCPIPQS
jgi:PAS domain S-box-containing protein